VVQAGFTIVVLTCKAQGVGGGRRCLRGDTVVHRGAAKGFLVRSPSDLTGGVGELLRRAGVIIVVVVFSTVVFASLFARQWAAPESIY
jgi:hypothetical protein